MNGRFALEAASCSTPIMMPLSMSTADNTFRIERTYLILAYANVISVIDVSVDT